MLGPKLTLDWSPEAEADLLVIWRWGATRFSPDTADTHLRDIHGKRPSGAVQPRGLKFQGISASISLFGQRLAMRSNVSLAQA